MQVYDIPIDEALRETTRHGSYDFPLAVYITRISKNVLGFVSWHWHKEVQFCLVLEGRVSFRVNSGAVEVAAGEGIFINASQLHMAKNCPGQDSTYLCLDVHPRLLSGFAGSAIQLECVDPFVRPDAPAQVVLSGEEGWQGDVLRGLASIEATLRDRNATSAPAATKLAVYASVVDIWSSMVSGFFTAERAAPPTGRDTMSERVRAMLRYIVEHYAEPITLDDVARAAAVAKGTCCRQFKQQMGCTVFAYLSDLRISEAAELLLSTDRPVTEVAYACGFASPSYFIKQFRQKVGVSPGAYRRKKQAPGDAS